MKWHARDSASGEARLQELSKSRGVVVARGLRVAKGFKHRVALEYPIRQRGGRALHQATQAKALQSSMAVKDGSQAW